MVDVICLLNYKMRFTLNICLQRKKAERSYKTVFSQTRTLFLVSLPFSENNFFQYTIKPCYPDTWFSRHSAYHISFSKSWFSVYDLNVKKTLDFMLLNNFQLRISRRLRKIGHFPYVVELLYLREMFVILSIVHYHSYKDF